jgi:hypothetical protein
VASGRWRLLGDQTVAVHTGPVSETGDRWRAVWETGLRIAALDGATALQQAGMRASPPAGSTCPSRMAPARGPFTGSSCTASSAAYPENWCRPAYRALARLWRPSERPTGR